MCVCVHWIKQTHDKKPVAIMKLNLFDSSTYSATQGSVRLVRFTAIHVEYPCYQRFTSQVRLS